jgi:flagellar motor protein MotB
MNEVNQDTELKTLPPLANLVVDRAIENANRKLIAGVRNGNNSRPGAKHPDMAKATQDAVAAASAQSAMAVANRGAAWKEMLMKSLVAGIGSIATTKFDGEIRLSADDKSGLASLPEKPGVYVVFDASGAVSYVGDSGNLKQRWRDGHMNDYQRKSKADGKPYKLAGQIEEGCTIKFIEMESIETAAALEARWIKTEKPPVNRKEELKDEQGKRSNIEAKKMKDSLDSPQSVALAAGQEALKNAGWQVFEQLASAVLVAIKDELVDLFQGGTAALMQRARRMLEKVWAVVRKIIEAPLAVLNGIVEFIVNALSHAFRQVYNLARNLFDLAHGAWQLYQGAGKMPREELVSKIVETVVVSGSLVLWDGLEPLVESQLAFLGPVAPFVSCVLTAMGFGLTSHYLQQVVPAVVEFLIDFKSGWQEAAEARRQAAAQLIQLREREWMLAQGLAEYAESVALLVRETDEHAQRLARRGTVSVRDYGALALTPRNRGA